MNIWMKKKMYSKWKISMAGKRVVKWPGKEKQQLGAEKISE